MAHDTSRSGPHTPAMPAGQQFASGISDAYALTDLLFDLLDSALGQIADLQAQVDALNPPTS